MARNRYSIKKPRAFGLQGGRIAIMEVIAETHPAAFASVLKEPVYDELIELLVQGGGPEAIIAYHSSKSSQARAYELVQKKATAL